MCEMNDKMCIRSYYVSVEEMFMTKNCKLINLSTLSLQLRLY